MGLTDLETIPDTGAVFTIGRSRFADNVASHFFIRKDPVVSITCGDEHSAVICQNGRLFVFGSNDWGQLGLGHRNHVSKPSCVKILKPEKVTHVACGRAHTLICTGAQKIFACGSDQEGQLGRGTSAIGDSASSPVLVYDSGLLGPKIVQIAAGSHHSLALTGDGGVFAWGSNLEGQLGLPDVSGLVNKPTKVHIPEPVRQISTGYYHSAFLTGYKKLPEITSVIVDRKVCHPVMTSGLQTVFPESGLVYVCGESESGKLGIDVNFSTQVTPKQMQLPVPAMHVACGGHHTIILAENGNLYCTGSNSSGQLGLGTNVTELHTPKLLPRGVLQDETITRIACGESHTAIVTASGKFFTCGDGRHGKLGLEENENNVHELTFAPRYKELIVSNVACGGCHTILIAHKRKINGTVEGETEIQMEHIQKRNLPPLKLPVSRLQSENHEDKPMGNEKEELHQDNNVTETMNATSPTTTETLENARNNQESVTNDMNSMDNDNKVDSPRSRERTPKKMASEVEANETSEMISKEASSVDDESKESKIEDDKNKADIDNANSRIEVDAENNVKEMEKSETTNSEEKNRENNNEENEESTMNNAESREEATETSNAMNGEESEDNKDDMSKAMNHEKESNDSDKEETSPAKQMSPSGSTPPPKPPRLKPGSGSSSPAERAQSMEQEDKNGDVNMAKEGTMAKKSETVDEKEAVQKRETSGTKGSMKSGSSRSTRSRVDTEETIEIDKQNDTEKNVEENMNNEHTTDDADVVQSPAPKAGKMSKMFKGKKHQTIENGTKAADTVNNKSKSKTCSIL